MPKYKVVLTVQDSFGMPKEVDGGEIDIDLAEALTPSDVQQLEQALPLKDYVKKTELPEELGEYATDTEVEGAVTFTTDKYVTTAFGDYAVGDSVKGQTITTVLAKLLGLSDHMPPRPSDGPLPDGPEQPDEPESDSPERPSEDPTPEEIVEYLISIKAAVYSQDAQGELVEAPFAVSSWNEDEAAAPMDGVSSVYTIADESGAVIETGYQVATEYTEEDWLTVALPSIIDKVKVKMYDPDAENWVDMNWMLAKVAEQTMPGYTLWAVPEEYEILSGDTYRFVILE